MVEQGLFLCAILIVVLCVVGTCFGQERPSGGITVVSPSGEEGWSAGSPHYILWETGEDAADSTVKIEFIPDGGQKWQTVEPTAPNTGRYLWTAFGRESAQCRIRITPSREGSKGDTGAGFSIGPSQEVRDYRWTNVTMEAPWAGWDGAGALVYNGKMWLLGGWSPKDKVFFPRICNNEVWCSWDGDHWEFVKPNTFLDDRFDPTSDWEGRHTAGYAVHDGKMWIVGGDKNQGHYQNDVWSSTDGAMWTLLNGDVAWGPRMLHHTVAFNGRIWVIGGQTMPGFATDADRDAESVFYDDVWWTTDGIEWTQIVPKEPSWIPRGIIGGGVVFEDRRTE